MRPVARCLPTALAAALAAAFVAALPFGARLVAQSGPKSSSATRTVADVSARKRAPITRAASPIITGKRAPNDSTAVKPAIRIVAAAFSVSGKPGSLEVVGIPVPTELSSASDVKFVIAPEGRSRIIGKTEGVVRASSGETRNIFFTVSAPAASSAGRMRVATAEFSATDLPTVVVPVDLLVAATHRVEFALLDQLVGARAGDAFVVRGRVTNFGNQTDTARVEAMLPQGWRDLSGATFYHVIVAPRESKDLVMRFWVPQQTPVGMSVIRVSTMLHGAPISTNTVDVQVGGRAGGLLAGPSMSLSAVSVNVPGQPVATGFAATLDGPISDSIYVRARASRLFASYANTGAQSGFSRAGLTNTAPTLELSAPRARLGLGLTGQPLSELTGMTLMGTGIAAELGRETWRTSFLAMRPYTPFSGPDTASGRMLGARVQRQSESSTFGISASHLDEALTQRRLDAVGGEYSLRSRVFGDLRSEAGYRRSDFAEGLGYVGELRKQGASGMLSLRLLHAPGGTRGYARATDEINALGSQKLTSFMDISGGYWSSGDQSNAISRNSSAGWSVGPSFNALHGRATMSLAARGFDYSASSAQGGFGSTERQGSVMIDTRHGSFHVSGASSIARLEKSTEFGGTTLPTTTGVRADHRLALGMGVLGGSVEISASSQQFAGEANAIPRQTAIGTRIDRIPLAMPFRIRPVMLSGEIQTVNAPWVGSSQPNTVTTARISASSQLFAGLRVTLSAERNPYFLAVSGSRNSAWMTSLRIDRTSVLPRLSGSTSGTVFRDLNNDGRQQKSEVGVAGIVVRCGSLTSITDSRGRYSCGGGMAAELDQRSLPMGWLAPPLKSGVTRSRDIGLVSVEAVRVQLMLDGLDSSRVSAAELQSVQVIARDSLGQAWLARSWTAGAAIFDALPPGTYTLDVDASTVSEPLRLVTANPKLVVRAEHKAEPIVLVLRGRETKVRVITPSASGASGGRANQTITSNKRSE